ncbi:hypothetical protein GN956_G5495 [Arapaima gigas]
MRAGKSDVSVPECSLVNRDGSTWRRPPQPAKYSIRVPLSTPCLKNSRYSADCRLPKVVSAFLHHPEISSDLHCLCAKHKNQDIETLSLVN